MFADILTLVTTKKIYKKFRTGSPFGLEINKFMVIGSTQPEEVNHVHLVTDNRRVYIYITGISHRGQRKGGNRAHCKNSKRKLIMRIYRVVIRPSVIYPCNPRTQNSG